AMSVVILGATSPIARAVANEFATAGHSIYVAARNTEEAAHIADDLAVRFGVPTASGAFDAVDFDTHSDFVDAVETAVGPINVALIAFGDMGANDPQQFDDVHKVIDVNYTGAVSICEQLVARMAGRGTGSVLGITSVAGDRGRQSNYIYGSAKGAFTL